MNERILSITPSVTLGISARAKQMAAEGRTIYNLGAGEPDFDTPQHIKDAAVDALAKGETKYAPTPGVPALRQAIAEKLASENGLQYEPEQIVVTNGAKHSLFNIFMALCEVGDEVILSSPYWLSYPEMVRVAGGTAVTVPAGEGDGFKLTPQKLEQAVTDRTKAVVLNSPCNPTGSVYSRDEMEAICDVIVRRGLTLVSDEIYEKLIYDGLTHVSPGSLSEAVLQQTVTVNGFSKAFSMTGWRLGYFAGPAKLIKAASGLQSHSTSGANTFAQFGAIAALQSSQDCVQEMAAEFVKRRDVLCERFAAIDGVTCVKPSGAFYLFPNISHFGLGSVTFAERLLEEAGVAVVPGAAFGTDACVRLSYACSMETLGGGMDKLVEFLASL